MINSKKGLLVAGLNPSEKYEFVNWDDEIPRFPVHGNRKNHVPNHQPDSISSQYYPLLNTIKHYHSPLMVITIPS